MPIKTTVFIIILLLFSTVTKAQVVAGRVLTEQNDPIPYATIFVQEAKIGTITNTEGNFRLQLPVGDYHLIVRSLGYHQVEKLVKVGSDSLSIDFKLKRQDFEIREVKVFPGKEDPAYFIMRKAIAKAPYYRSKIKHYEAGLYIKSNFAFTSIPKLYQNKMEVNGKKMKEVLKENVTYVIESQNEIVYDYPNRYNQKVISKKSSLTGFDEPPVLGLMTTSFYEERPEQLISPLSAQALRHYSFQYEGFISVGNQDIFKIKVIPKRKSDELITGFIYIADQLWSIYNLDFVRSFEFFNYRIKQQYENLGNNNWLPVSHVIDGQISMLGLKGLFYYGASLKYSNVEENIPPQTVVVKEPSAEKTSVKPVSKKIEELQREAGKITEKEELSNAEVKKVARLNRQILKEQYRDSLIVQPVRNSYKLEELKDTLADNREYWDTIRTIPLSPEEMQSYAAADSLRLVQKMGNDTLSLSKNKKEKSVLKKIVSGNSDLAKDSLLTVKTSGLLSPDNFGFNTVDGYKYKQQVSIEIHPDSAKWIRITPQLGYAFNRGAVFGSLKSRFTNVLVEKSDVEISLGRESRDFKPEPLGIDPALNDISSWFFAKNYIRFYETTFLTASWTQNINRNFSLFATTGYNHFTPLENHTHYRLSNKKDYEPNIPKGFSGTSPELAEQKSLTWSAGINFRKRQRKPWLPRSPFLFMGDFYNVRLRYSEGVKNVFSSVSDFSRIDFNFHQQANISPSAALEWKVDAGYFIHANQLHFSQFKHFKTAEIPVLFDGLASTFHLLNDYEFSTSKRYINMGGEFKSEYILLRYLSFINQKTWSESFHLNYLTTPALKNYWETGYSLNSLFFVGNIGVFAGFRGNKFEQAAIKISISGFD